MGTYNGDLILPQVPPPLIVTNRIVTVEVPLHNVVILRVVNNPLMVVCGDAQHTRRYCSIWWLQWKAKHATVIVTHFLTEVKHTAAHVSQLSFEEEKEQVSCCRHSQTVQGYF